jgi:flagellar biosynthesis/type III secretory pathway chaperone
MMTTSDRMSTLLAELRQVLEEERAALLSGSPERLSKVVERKLAVAEMIETECTISTSVPPNVETLGWLDRYNQENSIICSAMLRHMTRTIDKLRQHELHRSYGPDGAENSSPAHNPLGAA